MGQQHQMGIKGLCATMLRNHYSPVFQTLGPGRGTDKQYPQAFQIRISSTARQLHFARPQKTNLETLNRLQDVGDWLGPHSDTHVESETTSATNVFASLWKSFSTLRCSASSNGCQGVFKKNFMVTNSAPFFFAPCF